MDRLKKEWLDTKIPEEIRLRARNRAWADLAGTSNHWSRRPWMVAVSMIAVAFFLVALWNGYQTHREKAPVPVRSQISQPAIVAEKPVSLAGNSSAPAGHRKTRKPISQSPEEPERVVINFILPESGARMIWILDSQFELDGGIQ